MLVGGILEAKKVKKSTAAQSATTRQVEVKRFESMQYARIPTLARFGNPIFAVIGILVGAEIIRRKGAAPVT